MKNLTDREIIESIKRGSHNDFSILIDRYKNKSFSMLKRMLKNDMDAEELLQDCFMKAFNNLSGFKFESKFSTWFYRIVYNTALTKLSGKKRKFENDMSSIEEHFDLRTDDSPFIFEKNDISKLLNNLVEQLPPKYSSVISMFYLEEMSCDEIAEVMELSVPNVKVLLYRSRNALREIIEKNNFAMELL